MEYISTKQCASNWGITERAVQTLCQNNKIVGAKQIGKAWLIPISAKRPIDGRKKEARNKLENNYYHFPLFIFSELYPSRQFLTEDENTLIEAQELYLKGDYSQSIIVCRKILNLSYIDFHVKFGSYITMAYCSMLLGPPGEFTKIYGTLSNLVSCAKNNVEDYKLILAVLTHHTTWNTNDLFSIDVNKLSFEAFLYYQYSINLSNLVNNAPITDQMICSLTIFARNIELGKVEPATFIVNLIISNIYLNVKQIEKSSLYAKKAVDIALKNGWIMYIAKYYKFLSSVIDPYLNTIDKEYIEIIRKRSNKNIMNWRYISKKYTSTVPFGNIPIDLCDIAILLATNKSDKDISLIMNIPIKKEKENIQKLLEILNLSSRRELVKYAKDQNQYLL